MDLNNFDENEKQDKDQDNGAVDALTYAYEHMGKMKESGIVTKAGVPECLKEEFDPVNRPEHYTSGKYECIDVMEDNFGTDAVENFCMCNAFKYIFRAQRKNGVEDLKKAIWYLNKIIEIEERDK